MLPSFGLGMGRTADQPTLATDYSPTYDESATFVDYYFVLYQAQYPVVHEATFRAQWNEIVPRPATRE